MKKLLTMNDLLEIMPGHIYWQDRYNVIWGCNRKQAAAFGLDNPEEAIGKKINELEAYKYVKYIEKNNEKVYQTKEPLVFEEWGPIASGGEALFLSHKVPFIENNEVIGLLGISVELTEELSERHKQQYLLTRILEQMPAHIYWKDKNYIYIGCNQLQAESAGFKNKEDMLGKTDYEMPWKKDADGLRRIDTKVMETGQPYTAEEPSKLASGREAVFLSRKIPLYDSKGEIDGLLGISIDITDQKKLEETQKEIELLIEQKNSMNRQAATIAHELRTPLGAVKNSIESLKFFIDMGGLNEEQQQFLTAVYENIVSEADKTLSFIDIIMNNVKDLERVATNKLEIKACVEEAIQRFPYDADDMDKIKVLEIDNFTFRGEKDLMIHVLFNLIKNALFFIKKAKKGEITIWTKKDNKNNYLYFKDTGLGMSQEKHKKIFREFYTDTGIGTGVGLYFCKRVMTAFGGDIMCKSQEGEYTQFTLSFPIVYNQSQDI